MPRKPRSGRSWAAATVLLLGACGISQPENVPGLTAALGDALPGAQGLTIEDQERIDETVARGCAAGVWTRARCADHTPASAARRAVLSCAASASEMRTKPTCTKGVD